MRSGAAPYFFAALIFVSAAAGCRAGPLPSLHCSGAHIADAGGRTVALHGINMGGPFLFEGWESAFNIARSPETMYLPALKDERSLWQILTDRFGHPRMSRLREVWRTSWLTPNDVRRVAALDLSCIRLPFWYRLLQSDQRPNRLRESGLRLLKRVLAACRKYHVYVILDLHGAPGGQAPGQYTGEEGRNQLFKNPRFEEQTVNLWRMIARRYRNHSEIAGYDLLNEPMGAPTANALLDLYRRIYRAIRSVDRRHIIFMEDGYRGAAFFPDPEKMGWRNVVYSTHIYDFRATSPKAITSIINRWLPVWRKHQMRWNVPLFIGEFSTINDRQGGVGSMKELFAAFNRYGWSWTPWNYKEVDAEDGRRSIWGLYTNDRPWDEPDPYTNSFNELKRKFAEYRTRNLVIQADYAAALKEYGGSDAADGAENRGVGYSKVK